MLTPSQEFLCSPVYAYLLLIVKYIARSNIVNLHLTHSAKCRVCTLRVSHLKSERYLAEKPEELDWVIFQNFSAPKNPNNYYGSYNNIVYFVFNSNARLVLVMAQCTSNFIYYCIWYLKMTLTLPKLHCIAVFHRLQKYQKLNIKMSNM